MDYSVKMMDLCAYYKPEMWKATRKILYLKMVLSMNMEKLASRYIKNFEEQTDTE